MLLYYSVHFEPLCIVHLVVHRINCILCITKFVSAMERYTLLKDTNKLLKNYTYIVYNLLLICCIMMYFEYIFAKKINIFYPIPVIFYLKIENFKIRTSRLE